MLLSLSHTRAKTMLLLLLPQPKVPGASLHKLQCPSSGGCLSPQLPGCVIVRLKAGVQLLPQSFASLCEETGLQNTAVSREQRSRRKQTPERQIAWPHQWNAKSFVITHAKECMGRLIMSDQRFLLLEDYVTQLQDVNQPSQTLDRLSYWASRRSQRVYFCGTRSA